MNPEREDSEFRTPAKSFDTEAPSLHSTPPSEGEADKRMGWIINGVPRIWEVPLPVHETTAGRFTGLAEQYNLRVAGNDYRNWPLFSIRSSTFKIRRGLSKEPDEAFCRAGRHTPNIIIEIANTQPMSSLSNVCQIWFELANVLLFVGIKIYEAVEYHEADIVESRRALVALLFTREDIAVPTRVISFGDRAPNERERQEIETIANGTVIEGVGFPGGVPCNAYGIPMYQLTLPSDLLLALDEDGDRVVRSRPRVQYPDWTVDLFDLLAAIHRADNVWPS